MNESPGMRDDKGSEAKRPPLSPSLLFAAVVSTVFSVVWLTRGPKQPMDLRILLAPIYIPLTFGILWPVTVAMQALATPSARSHKLWRNWVAVILFVVSSFCWIPFVRAEIANSKREREEARRQIEWQRERQAEIQAAQLAIERGGVLAFTEPLRGQEGFVLQRFIYERHLSEAELQQASERYQTPLIMTELAGKSDCPPEALEAIFDHALSQQRTIPDAQARSQLAPVFLAIGKNGNTPAKVLVEMARSESPYVREAVIENPRLSKNVKLEYLKKGCDLSWPSELRLVAGDADTPVDVLTCLSTKPDAAYEVARNPHTPTAVLESMSKSDNYWLKTAGQENLAKRQADIH